MDVPFQNDSTGCGSLDIEHHVNNLHSANITLVSDLNNYLGVENIVEIEATALDLRPA